MFWIMALKRNFSQYSKSSVFYCAVCAVVKILKCKSSHYACSTEKTFLRFLSNLARLLKYYSTGHVLLLYARVFIRITLSQQATYILTCS